jgi:hypothetical protein
MSAPARKGESTSLVESSDPDWDTTHPLLPPLCDFYQMTAHTAGDAASATIICVKEPRCLVSSPTGPHLIFDGSLRLMLEQMAAQLSRI